MQRHSKDMEESIMHSVKLQNKKYMEEVIDVNV